MGNTIHRIDLFLRRPINTSSLAFFRILFGALMAFSIVRFWSKGWIEELYVKPIFYFSYYGFEWVQNPGYPWIYILFGLILLSALGILFGCFYRISTIVFFITFTYVELLDKSNYLNHYYFVSLVSFLLIFIPAHRIFSIDAFRNKNIASHTEPMIYLFALQLQVAIVYIFGAVAKLKYDWLVDALPLKIWLNANSGMPVIGRYLGMEITAYIFSYAGLLFDLFVPFILWSRRWKWVGYVLVLIFHLFTHLFFYIGMFPFFMMLFTLIFLDTKVHATILGRFFHPLPHDGFKKIRLPKSAGLLVGFFFIQLIVPFRYLLYPGNNLWHEQAYRWSWNIMLMEKNGDAEFIVFDKHSSKTWLVKKKEYLTPQQERMMNTQPDMILQFAHYLKSAYGTRYQTEVGVRVRAYVALNGRSSQLLIDPEADLTEFTDGFTNKTFITRPSF
jgi:hypothetical protein